MSAEDIDAECEQCRDRRNHEHFEFCGEDPNGELCGRIVVDGECPEHGPVGP